MADQDDGNEGGPSGKWGVTAMIQLVDGAGQPLVMFSPPDDGQWALSPAMARTIAGLLYARANMAEQLSANLPKPTQGGSELPN